MAMEAEPTITITIESSNISGISTQQSGRTFTGIEPGTNAWLRVVARFGVTAFYFI